ncbi:hypothetical protein L1987_87146 [Smallanthus sonchifolius]|nr:hypothetical protein L1987_87146 [Smallanthus sonchifolius]
MDFALQGTQLVESITLYTNGEEEGTKVPGPNKRGGFMTMTFGKRPQILVRLVLLNWLSWPGVERWFMWHSKWW